MTRIIIRSYWWIGIACIALLTGAILPLSRMAVWPVKVEINGTTVSVVRYFPGDFIGMPRPRLRYIETVRGLSDATNGGHVCATTATLRYTSASPVGSWTIDWAEPCLSDPVGYRWESCWTWRVGVLSVGPTCLDKIMQRGEK